MTTATSPQHYEEDLPAYVNGTLEPEQARIVAAHLSGCAACRAEEADWRAASLATQTAFAAGSAPRGLLDRVWLQIGAEEGPGRRSAVPLRARLARALGGRFWARPSGPLTGSGRRLAAGAAALACLLLVAYAGARADNLFNVFKPQQFTVVPLSPQDLQSLPDLSNYGTFTGGGARLSQATPLDTPAAAAAAAGFAVQTPRSLPAAVTAAPEYTVVPGNSTSFTFSAEKAGAAAAAQGKTLPPMPAGVDGSTLQLITNPAVLAIYGNPPSGGSQTATGGIFSSIPTLVIGQTTAPKVVATGASADDIEHYLLSLPGVSPQLAAAIRALGAPGSTWPVPIPVSVASSQSVTVQGVKGVAIGDSTGLGAGILWQKNGMVYAVAGTLSQQELLSIANSLH